MQEELLLIAGVYIWMFAGAEGELLTSSTSLPSSFAEE